MKNTRTANSSPPAPHGQHPAPYPYDPEIEARRADYEKLAESLLHLIELETQRTSDQAQLDPEGFWKNDPKKPLQGALHDHLYLVAAAMEFFVDIVALPERQTWGTTLFRGLVCQAFVQQPG